MKKSYQKTIESKQNLDGWEYSDTLFRNCQFIEEDWSRVTFENCCFESCNISSREFKGAKLQDVSIRKSKIVGGKFFQCHEFSSNFSFHDSVLISCNFTDMSLIKNSFVNCDLKECFFDRALLREASFQGSSLPKENRKNNAKFLVLIHK